MPNSPVTAAGAAAFDDTGRLLWQRRTDNGLWAMPGGVMEMTESLPQAAVREVQEETGCDAEITGLVGTYTDTRHVIAYSDGEVRRQFNVCFRAALLGGELRGGVPSRVEAREGTGSERERGTPRGVFR